MKVLVGEIGMAPPEVCFTHQREQKNTEYVAMSERSEWIKINKLRPT